MILCFTAGEQEAYFGRFPEKQIMFFTGY